jgi:hypothetical protein
MTPTFCFLINSFLDDIKKFWNLNAAFELIYNSFLYDYL